jgi:pyruvate dehydrogenase (quinone)/pyruvate oxidase
VEEAFAVNGPAVVEAVVDPYFPPMPGKINMEQAFKFAESLVRGTPDRGKIIKSIVGEKIRELV